MHSMRTNGASKNRVVFVCLTFAKNGDDFPLLSIWIIFGTYGMCTYGKYTYSTYTANTYSGKTVEVQWNHCDFEKIQWFTTDHASLYFLPVKIVILALFYM